MNGLGVPGGSNALTGVPLGNASGVVNIDASAATLWTATLTGDTTLNFINIPSGLVFTPRVVATQDGTGGHALAFTANGSAISIIGGSPAINSAASATSYCALLTPNAGTTWINTLGAATGMTNPMTAKGDIIGGGAGGAATRLPVGADGQALFADSTQTLGIKWAAVAGGTVTRTPLTADNSAITSSTTLANLGLPFTIGTSATEMWAIRWHILVTAANATMDMQFGMSGPAAATADWGVVGGGSQVNGWQALTTSGSPLATLAIGGTVAVATLAGKTGVIIDAIVYGGGTGGSVNLRIAQNTSDAGTLVVNKGSYVEYVQIHS